ncbi:hypothetical protein A2685_00065 [Candidatus Woesebacteria bacterium RIFCSPHIGHO2_01_FULL_37_10]|uniref:Uncharacterized protein n=1 Tax=Candidatus Woesebacteria bacterium RIFCSPHIGHO2_01_FULL_37_10 TaxID=1802489 RepID=A0A1F7XSG9_9BACT|nr:MAG: hypothetical protein A2685_00065 [Candidatus Woesebacteria bacterium RIFCSPHIGHO2_01_FULL_37_10]
MEEENAITSTTPEPKNGSNKMLWVAIIVLILLILAATGYFIYSQSSSNKTSELTPTPLLQNPDITTAPSPTEPTEPSPISSPSATPKVTVKPSATPTGGVQGLKANPTNIPTPTSLPIQY